MAFRTQKAGYIAIIVAFTLGTPLFAQRELQFEARHDHSIKSCTGTLRFTELGVVYHEVNKGKQEKDLHRWQWNYQDIEQLWLSPEKLVVLAYEDRKWLLGMDKKYEFTLTDGEPFRSAYNFLKGRLDERFVAAIAEPEIKALWQIPVKQLGRIRGSEGILIIGEDQIVYKTDAEDKSRSWRYSDIENVSTSGPYQLTLTTFERAKFHYGDRKGFNFQLKQRLNEDSYNELWRRINASKGLKFLGQLGGGSASL